MVSSAAIHVAMLVLWAADRNLLAKVWYLVTGIVFKCVWTVAGWYAMRRARDSGMIKDGYHVDEVYLRSYTLEDPEVPDDSDVDVLRMFRDRIRQREIGADRGIPVLEFVSSCCRPNSNFVTCDLSKRWQVFVIYTFDQRQYLIAYDSARPEPTEIRFPPYPEDKLRASSRGLNEIVDAALVSSVSPGADGWDVTAVVQMAAGPMHDFYASTPHVVTREHLNFLLQYLERVTPRGCPNVSSCFYLRVFDAWGTIYTFAPSDRVLRVS